MSKPPAIEGACFDHIQAFLDKTRGQLTIGEIPPIRRAALAAVGKKVRVALVCGERETATELLRRLDTALGKAIKENTVIDEVLPEIQRRR
jgi:predicted thioesterase